MTRDKKTKSASGSLAQAIEFAQSHSLDVVLLLTLCHWMALSTSVVEWFFRGWFWTPTDKPAGSIVVILALIALVVASLWIALRMWRRPGIAVGLLVLCGFGLQMSLAFTEDRGLDGVRDRIVRTGHAEFMMVAAREASTWEVMTHYEEMVSRGRLGKYAQSKPPGQLLLYMVTQRVANVFHPSPTEAGKLEWARTFASVTWPLISFLVLFPIFYIARAFWDERRSLIACLLYLLVPSVQLITLHTDQTFFPLFFMLPILCAVLAFSKRSLTLAALTGVAVYVASFMSFPLGISAIFAVAATLALARRDSEAWDRRQFLRLWGIAAGATVAIAVIAWLALGYDIVERYRGALAYHARWKAWEPGAKSVFYYGVLNLAEFVLWLGIPLGALLTWRLRGAVADAAHRRLDLADALGIVLIASLAYFVLFGKTEGEVARIWLFHVPVVCILAADMLERRFPERLRQALIVLAGCQAITLYLTKRFQDFH